MKIKVIYTHEKRFDETYWDSEQDEHLCFICATKRSLTLDPKNNNERISVNSTQDSIVCCDCDNYISNELYF